MNKLISLLNKFEREVYPEDHKYIKFPDGTETDGGYWIVGDGFNFTKKGEIYYSEPKTFRDGHEELLIISKSFGFIERLVDNDKIDYEELDFKIRDYNSYIDSNGYYDALLMLLAIQDNPIEYLCSILKE